jgi:WWE domain
MKIGWRLYDPQQQADLDANAQSGATNFQINIEGTIYEINLTSWKQINTANRMKTRKIKHDFPNGVRGYSTFQRSGHPPIISQPSSIIRQPLPFVNTETSLHHEVCNLPPFGVNICAKI